MPLLAVHISADVLSGPCMLLGFVALAGFLALGLFRLHEDEVARIGLLGAAFFVASQIHVSLGPTSVHLLLTGLVGMILGRRACVAIPVGVTLQAALLGHGSIATIGVNSCVMILPALLARPLFQALMHGWRMPLDDGLLAVACLLHPWSLIVAGPIVFAARRLHRRMNLTTAFDAGFVVGTVTVFLSSVLNSLVLALGGVEDWTVVAVLSLTAHLPVALIEGVILGTVVDVLMKVKPGLLMPTTEEASVTQPEISPPAALPTAPAPR